MKVVPILCYAISIFIYAAEVTDKDINSPLFTYLLAKVQQLESKVVARPTIRNTREITDKPTKHLLLLLTTNSVTLHQVHCLILDRVMLLGPY